MTAGVLRSGVSVWIRGLAVAAAGLLVGLAPLSQAEAAGGKRAAAVKHAQTHRAAKPARSEKTAKASRSAKATHAAKPAKADKHKRGSRAVKKAQRGAGGARQAAAHVESVGQQAGLHAVQDELALNSGVALVVDQDTQEVLLNKNGSAVLPIASLTKLMTGLVVSEANLPLDEPITITQEDVDTERGSHSRLAVGTELTRGELLHLALMSSENRAAHALGRTFPGGMSRFVRLMNARATALGMAGTRYVEPTGLSSGNRSSAHDLAALVAAASRDALLRQLSTSPGYEVAVGNRVLQYKNTNRLVRDPDWQIDLQKTGYIAEAGRCLVMQARVAGRKLIMVFLDAAGKQSRLADAERVRNWIELRRAANAVAGGAYPKG
jgi:D-alanyl-D-alanine endopeptidase (penicillin-binding protein 7)